MLLSSFQAPDLFQPSHLIIYVPPKGDFWPQERTFASGEDF